MVPSVTLMNDHSGKVAGTLTEPFFLSVIEQQVCLTHHMLRSARCDAAVLLLKMLSKSTHILRGGCHKRSCCFSWYRQHDILHANLSLQASCSVAEGLCIMKLSQFMN